MEENIYHAICKISNKCKKYFYNNKYFNFDKITLDKNTEDILKAAEELEIIFKAYKKEEK